MLADSASGMDVKVGFGVLPVGAGKSVAVQVLHPNSTEWKAVGSTQVNSATNTTAPIKIPLHRGCAMVQLLPA
jgi:hypothetical protein